MGGQAEKVLWNAGYQHNNFFPFSYVYVCVLRVISLRFYNDSFIPRDNKKDEENKRDWPGIFQSRVAASAFAVRVNIMDESSTCIEREILKNHSSLNIIGTYA